MIDALRAGRQRATNDALIGSTAEGEGLALVTEDGRLRARALEQLSVPVLDWPDFVAALVWIDAA